VPWPASPSDWDDRAAWDEYLRACWDGAAWREGLTPFELGLQFVEDLRRNSARRVWFPGSGLSLAPRAYAALGFEALATDLSPVSAAFQAWAKDQELWALGIEALIEGFTRQRGAARPGGALESAVHDFREGAPAVGAGGFDCALNFRALQGLSPESLRRAAAAHYQALRPGGWAIFQTMNVPGPRRDALEDALRDAGFYLPYQGAERWYRRVLAATGIPFLMIPGRPSYAPGQDEEGQQPLDSYRREYEERRRAEAPELARRLSDGESKIAFVVYSTG
jgi:SAM-dependent methyltransferase